jgi:hypothetical protein
MTKAEPATVGLGAGDRVAIIAGSGRLPRDVADGLKAQGHEPFVVVIEGEADETAYAHCDHRVLALEDVGDLLRVLKRNKATHVVLAGGVSRRPHWRTVRVSMGLLLALMAFIRGLVRGDDGLLRVLVGIFEKQGLTVVGAHEIVPDLLADAGPMTARKPSPQDRRDIEAAWAAAQAIGALDVGQAAVAIGGRAVALEDIEGTDRLLERVAGFRGHGRLARSTAGVLVKCAKPGQELRADLPAIGPLTVEGARKAGLAGIGVEAGRSLILQRREVVEAADRAGIFICGLDREGR